MIQPNEINIPAFQRKRSIAAKEKLTSKKIKIKPSKVKTRKRPENEILDIPIKATDSSEIFEKSSLKSRMKKAGLREMKICGVCEGFFDKINVAVIKVSSAMRKDDNIFFETTSGLFEQPLASMQKNRKDIKLASSGSEIGIKVLAKPKVGGLVFKEI